jgi:hypothetical protein
MDSRREGSALASWKETMEYEYREELDTQIA